MYIIGVILLSALKVSASIDTFVYTYSNLQMDYIIIVVLPFYIFFHSPIFAPLHL